MSDEPSIVNHRLTSMEAALGKMANAFEKLVILEAHHSETRKAIQKISDDTQRVSIDHEARIRILEQQAPVAQLTSKWVQHAILALLGVIGLALIKLTFKV